MFIDGLWGTLIAGTRGRACGCGGRRGSETVGVCVTVGRYMRVRVAGLKGERIVWNHARMGLEVMRRRRCMEVRGMMRIVYAVYYIDGFRMLVGRCFSTSVAHAAS